MSEASLELPTPDYNAGSGVDMSLQMPAVIHYDDWRSSAKAELPEPPAELLLEEDEDLPEPPPDYEWDSDVKRTDEGLIAPHKLPNPVMDSKERVNLNSEIKWNVKRGINVLNTKPELQKELDRRKEEKRKKELAEREKCKRTSLEVKLEKRFEKIDTTEHDAKKSQAKQVNKTELEKIQEKIRTRSEENS